MLRLFTVKYEETDAYKLGIINDKGEQLIKMRNFVRREQSDAYTLLHRLVFRLRGLIEKIPFVKSRLANYAAALILIREKIVKEEEFFELSDQVQESLDRDVNSYDRLVFNFVWLKTRKPDLYDELMRNFDQMEPNVYAHRQKQDAKDLF